MEDSLKSLCRCNVNNFRILCQYLKFWKCFELYHHVTYWSQGENSTFKHQFLTHGAIKFWENKLQTSLYCLDEVQTSEFYLFFLFFALLFTFFFFLFSSFLFIIFVLLVFSNTQIKSRLEFEVVTTKCCDPALTLCLTGAYKLWGNNIHVNWADPEKDVADEVMQRYKVLYVRTRVCVCVEILLYLCSSDN